MNATYCSCISGFLLKFRCRDSSRLTACSLLFGRCWRGSLNGNGATQLLASSLRTFLSIITRNKLSSLDGASLLSCSVLLNTVCPSNLSGDLLGLLKLGCVSLMDIKLVHGLKMECRQLSNTWVFRAFTVGLCTLPKHTSPITTQPRSSRWAKGASCGPLICCLTLCAHLFQEGEVSPPLHENSGMCLAIWRR